LDEQLSKKNLRIQNCKPSGSLSCWLVGIGGQLKLQFAEQNCKQKNA